MFNLKKQIRQSFIDCRTFKQGEHIMRKNNLYKIYSSSPYSEQGYAYFESDKDISELRQLCNGIQFFLMSETRLPTRLLIPCVAVSNFLCNVFDCKFVDEANIGKYMNYNSAIKDVYSEYTLDLYIDYDIMPYKRILAVAEYLENIFTNLNVQEEMNKFEAYIMRFEKLYNVDFEEIMEFERIQ